MRKETFLTRFITLSLMVTLIGLQGCSLPEPPQSSPSIPTQFADSQMPEGWWSDESIIEQGPELYLGRTKSLVNCANCHGKDGRPVKGRARNFKDVNIRTTYSDDHLLWRISEGIPFTRMGPYKERLSEEEIWKVIAFIGTLGPELLTQDQNQTG